MYSCNGESRCLRKRAPISITLPDRMLRSLMRVVIQEKFPFALAKANGSWVEDVEGNRYLDFLCGAGTLALGHNDAEVNQAMIDLISSNAPLHTLDLTTPVKDEFVHTVLSSLPKEMAENARIQFCSPSGSDACDAAIKLCKTATGRASVIAFQGGYHGMGQGRLHAQEILALNRKFLD